MRMRWTVFVLTIAALAATAAAADDTRAPDAGLPPLRGVNAEEVRALAPAPAQPRHATVLSAQRQVATPPPAHRETASPQVRSDIATGSAPEIVDAPAPPGTGTDFNWSKMSGVQTSAVSQLPANPASVLQRGPSAFPPAGHSKALRIPDLGSASNGYKPMKVDGAPLLLGAARAVRPQVRARKSDLPIVAASWLAIAVCTFILVRHLAKHLKAKRRTVV